VDMLGTRMGGGFWGISRTMAPHPRPDLHQGGGGALAMGGRHHCPLRISRGKSHEPEASWSNWGPGLAVSTSGGDRAITTSRSRGTLCGDVTLVAKTSESAARSTPIPLDDVPAVQERLVAGDNFGRRRPTDPAH